MIRFDETTVGYDLAEARAGRAQSLKSRFPTVRVRRE